MPLRSVILFHLLAVGMLAAEQPSPAPIPPERHEAISRQMLDLQRAQTTVYATQYAADKARQNEAAEEAKYETMLKALIKEFHAEGCDLTVDKVWSCPEAKASPKK